MLDIKNVSKQLGQSLEKQLNAYRNGNNEQLSSLIFSAFNKNGWFTEGNILFSIEQWVRTLQEDNIEKWLSPYSEKIPQSSVKKIGVINAGNLPFSGMHDLLCVLNSQHSYFGKNASDDPYLLPWIAFLLIEIEPELKCKINFIERLENPDAVIATGSNNTSRYFEYYFGKYPHIIRKNRNGVAVLSGNESKSDLKNLGEDIFRYFGMGCRNVSKLYVPKGYTFDSFFESMYEQNEVMQNNKYMNNFDYNNSVLLLKRVPFLQNGFLIIFEDERIPSPVSILHYEFYESNDQLSKKLEEAETQLQCIVSSENSILKEGKLKHMQVNFGETQKPNLWDYADRVDTMKFLTAF